MGPAGLIALPVTAVGVLGRERHSDAHADSSVFKQLVTVKFKSLLSYDENWCPRSTPSAITIKLAQANDVRVCLVYAPNYFCLVFGFSVLFPFLIDMHYFP